MRVVIALCALLFTTMFVTKSAGQTAANYQDTLEKARGLYDFGKFDSSLTLLLGLQKDQDFPDSLKGRLYELFAKNYFGKSREEYAMKYIRQLLLQVPGYRPPPDPPEFAALVEVVRREMPAIRVINPVNGALWLTGTRDTVRWSAQNVPGNITILLSLDGGQTYPTTLATVPAGAGVAVVDVPPSVSTTTRVKVVSFDDSSLAAESADFTIAARTITVLSPAAGVEWKAGRSETVSWYYQHVDGDVKITLSTDGGSTFPIVLSASTQNDGREMVKIPDIESDACKVRIELVVDRNVTAVSRDLFSVAGEGGGIKIWPHVVMGVVGAIGVTYFIFKPDEKAERTALPGPPGRPTGQ